MTTLANNTENGNNVANNQDGYNSEVTNEVVVLNGDTFYKKNIVIGQKYRYGSHYFTIERFETRGTHLYYIGTLDKKPFENDLHALKVACECTERRAKSGSANDTENGKAVKVKRTTKESAQLIAAKYAKAIEAINSAVAKLTNSDNTANLLHSLIDSLNADCNAQIEAINNAAIEAHNKRLQEIEYIEEDLPRLQEQINEAMQAMDFAKVATLGKTAQEMQAQLLLLQQQEIEYDASFSPATETADENASESEETTEETETEEAK